MLTGQGSSVRNKGSYLVFVMSEEQLKAAEIEATAEQEEDAVEEISEEDLAGVAGGDGQVIGTYYIGVTERT